MNISEFCGKIISSYRTSIVLMLIYAMALAIATFVEHIYSTEVAKVFFYYSPLLFLIQFLMIVNFVAVVDRYQLFTKKNFAFLIIHGAFVVILVGAFVTHLFGEEGTIHLRENERVDKMLVQTNKGSFHQELPFSIELQKFILSRYPGSSSPSSFESILKISTDGESRTEHISMNNVLDIKEYRLFQASYDTDEKGSILSVNKDLYGRNITYAGYLLLVLGFALSFVSKHSRLKYLSLRLKALQLEKVVVLFLFITSSLGINAQDIKSLEDVLDSHKIPIEHAAKFGAIPMQPANGRMKPINTFSSEVLRKIYHEESWNSLNSDQFLLSLLTFPDLWKKIPLIYQDNKNIANEYALPLKHCAYADMFDSNGFYKLEKQVRESHSKATTERTKFDKDIIKLDERVNTLHLLTSHRLLHLFPKKNDENNKWYASGDDLSSLNAKDSVYIVNMIPQYILSVSNSLQSGNWENSDDILTFIKEYQSEQNTTLSIDKKKIDAEILFNQLDIFRQSKRIYLICGGLLTILFLFVGTKMNRIVKYASHIAILITALAFLYHLFGLSLRGYIGGYAPWSNSYETMVYIALISVVGGFIFIKKSKITFALSVLFAGIVLFVSELNWMDPQITALVPVLKSPWLMIHVAVIVAAYSFFGISCLLGITNLSMILSNKKGTLTMRITELTIINEISLQIGLALMTVGTFLGAVWANESWGRYWGWDSKETWALITIMVYAMVTHTRLVKKWNQEWRLNLLSVLAFIAVLMTYFGVNYLLSGLHSYA